MNGRRSRLWLLAIAALLAAVTLWWSALESPDGGVGARTFMGRSSSTRPRPSAALPPPQLRDQHERPAPGFPAVDRQGVGGPGPHFTHYRGTSGRLEVAMRPTAPDPISKSTSVERRPTLEVWVPRLRVDARGTTIFARVFDEHDVTTAIRADAAVAEDENAGAVNAEAGAAAPALAFSPMVEDAAPREGGRLFHVAFVPRSRPRDATAGGTTTAPPRRHRFVVIVRGRLAGEAFVREAGGLFYVHDPGARLAPDTARAFRQDGDLAVTVDAQVDRPGRYFALAELWGRNGETAVAFARERLAIATTGVQSIHLRFGGRIVRDAGVDGPYLVRNLRLMQVDTHPAQEGDPLPVLPATAAWPANSFE